jgi:hypothetical protein
MLPESSCVKNTLGSTSEDTNNGAVAKGPGAANAGSELISGINALKATKARSFLRF